MPLNKVIFNNNSQNNNTFLKKGTPEGPKPVEENVNIPIVQADQPQQEIIATASIAVPTIPIGSRPNVLRPNISKNEGSVKYTSPTSNKNKFTSKLLNYVEPYEVGGVRKTAFYSEISTNFKVGERVFIINGNYDSHDKILNDKYSKGSDGYKVLLIEDCKVVLDVDYTGVNPYESPLDINDLIFVHNIDYTNTNYRSDYSEPFNYISTFKTYVTDTTIPGDLVSLFQGKVVSNVLRTWTGNIIFNKFAQSKNTTDVDFLDSHTGAFTPPGSVTGGAFFVRDSLSSPVAGNWIDISAQIRTNQIRLMDTLSNPTNEIGNKRLFILGEDFTWEGTNFQERQIYKFDKTTSKWVIDRQYKIPIITATYFKYGKFIGEHNGGLFGTYLKSNKWQNATWNYGVMINSDWNNGLMNTNTKVGDRVVRASLLYDQFSIPYVSQVVDTTNNSGLGYNLTIDSKIIKGVFLQSTFENCNIKSGVQNPVVNYYSKTTPNYDITANFSKFKFCDLDSVILSSSTLVDSIVENSTLKRTKAVNSQIFTSVFDSGEFNSDSGVRILGAELNSWDPQLGTFTDNSQMVGVLKLFISDEDFFRMEKNDTFYIERVNKEFFLGNLDTDNRIILPYETKYLLNLYWDAEFTSKVGSKQAVSVRDKRSNRNRFYISRSTSAQFQTKEVPNTTLINGITWWTDVTARFSLQANRLSPAYDPSWIPTAAEVTAGTWFYYLYEVPQQVAPPRRGGLGLIESPALEEVIGVEPLPAEPIGGGSSIYGYGQTLHIFKYISVPTSQETIMAIDGYTPVYTETYERVFTNTNGPFDSLSRGQYRGEYNTDIQSFLINQTTPIYGANSYQVNDVVRIYNPQTERWEYYQCLRAHDPQLTPDSYVTRQYQTGGANQKVLVSETSKYYNYCSIDIETRALGWYRDVQLNKDVYTFDRDQLTITMPLKPKMDNLLPINIVDKIFKNVLIKNSNFHSGVFVNSNWVSGSLIEDFELVIYNRSVIPSEVPEGVGPRYGAKLVMSREQPGVSPLSSNLNVFTKFNQLRGVGSWLNPSIKLPQLGEVMHINSITYQSPTQKVELEGQYVNGVGNLLGGLPYYKLSGPGWGTSPLLSISENITVPNSPMSSFLTNVGTYSIIGSETINYASMHRVVIENSTVYSGVFKRAYFKNTKLTNRVPYVKPSTFDIDPTALPKVVNVVFARNNSLVENGFIYQSHITNITNTGGYFHSCYWNGATFSNGEFQSGYWLNGTFLNGKFSDSNSLTWYYITIINGTEQVCELNDDTNQGSVNPYISAINYFDIAKKPIRRIWNDGRFLSGEFYNSYWVDGTFSNGKFWRSKWFAGDFESGIFGDQSIKYEETTFGYGWYSPNPVDGINWLPTIYALEGFEFSEKFLGRTQSKFFGGVVQNGLVGGNGVVFWYNGQMSAGEFTSASASSNMQSIWYNGTFYGSVFGNYAQWKNGIFNSGKFRSIYGYENQRGILTYRDYLNAPVFSWENGTFNGGEFGLGSLDVNSSWKSGNFAGGIFQGRIWYDGVFSGGIFMGSGGVYTTGTPSRIDNSVENAFYLSFRPIENPSSDVNILGKYYGLWYNGVVTDKRYQYISKEKVFTKIKRAESKNEVKNKVTLQNLVWLDGLFDHENGKIEDSLFIRGTFSNGTFDGGIFNPYVSRYNVLTMVDDEFILTDELNLSNYKFSDSLDGLYENFSVSSGYSVGDLVTYGGYLWQVLVDIVESTLTTFDLGLFSRLQQISRINWIKGTFVTGSFYSAQWTNGIFKNGYISGAYWKNGTFEYGVADNIFWDGGTWKNGNWNGAPFNHLIVGTGPGNLPLGSHSVKPGRSKDIIINTDLLMRTNYKNDFKISESNNKSYLFLSNVFSASPTPEKFGLYNLPMYLKESEYHEIWLPYFVSNTSDTNSASYPRPTDWTTFLSTTTATGLIFWLSEQRYNVFTQSNNVSGGNLNTGMWSWMYRSRRNLDGTTPPELTSGAGNFQPLAQIKTSHMTYVNTPQAFCDYINGNTPHTGAFTWSGIFTHTAEIFNFQGKVGVKLRFYNYRSNPFWYTFSEQPTIQIQNGNVSSGSITTGGLYFRHLILDLVKDNNDRYGWVTSSFFVSEINLPNDPKKVDDEFYEAKDYVSVIQSGNSALVENYEIRKKPCSDWEYSDGIPFYWDGKTYRIDPPLGPDVKSKYGTKEDGQPRNYVNISSKFSNQVDLPTPAPVDSRTLNASLPGYNTLPKKQSVGLSYNNRNEDGSIPNSAPSLKLYPRFGRTKLYKSYKFYNRNDCAKLIRAINSVRPGGSGNPISQHLPFNGVTGSRVAFYINDFSDPSIPGSGCSTLNGEGCFNRAYGFEIAPPFTALVSASNTTATNDEIDALALYLNQLNNVYTSGGSGDPNAFSGFSFYRVGGDVSDTQVGMGCNFELYNIYNFSSSFRPFGNLQASLAGPPTTPQEWEFKQLYYESGGGSNLYQSPFNNATKTYDIIQFTTEIEVSVELEKEVSFDFFIGASFSSYTLKSIENISFGQKNYFPAFYRIKLNYITTLETIWSGVSTENDDVLRSWIRKTSFGILRIYSWTVRKRKVTYDGDYNNTLYSSIDQSTKFIGLPATPSVALNLPTDSNNDNSISFGNGVFRQGVWESGVWNGGYRHNSDILGFFDGDDILKGNNIVFAIRKTAKDTLWSIKIQLVDNLSAYKLKLDVGGKISVSNLAAYDNNKRRIFISSVLDVETYSFDDNTITVSYKSLTPISYIEKDSENHLIYMTTNIWTNGAFLNGVFRGVWNNGLFKGSPFLTKMIDSHFIDGTFEGGHFKSVHQREGLTIYGKHNTGLIQNFKFKDLNNGSPNSQWETNNITQLRNFYQSWIDVVYSTYSMVNLKQDTTQLRVKQFIPLMIGSEKGDVDYFSQFSNTNAPGFTSSLTSTIINQPNLKGYPTVDVLSSRSEFRDFLSTQKKVYRLGTKRKVFDNLLPDNGNFIKPVASNATLSKQINVNYPGLFPTYPAFQNLTVPFFTTNTSQLSYGYTYSILWRRVGSRYVTPGYIGSNPKTWVINQTGHGNRDTPLKFTPKDITVTFGDTITFRLNDLRKPALTWGYTYNTNGFKVRSFWSPYSAYEAVSADMNNSSMYPWNNFDASFGDGVDLNAIPRQLNEGSTNINDSPMGIFGWNAYNPYEYISPFGDHPTQDPSFVTTPTTDGGPGYNRNNSVLGNRILLVAGNNSNRPLYDTKDDQRNTLAWAFTDAGYAYPQERSINTETGIRSVYIGPAWAQVPIKTNQNSTRTGPGPTLSSAYGTNVPTNGLTHGIHYYINANKLIPLYSDILSKTWNTNLMTIPANTPIGYLSSNIARWRYHLSLYGRSDYYRFNPTEFNPYGAYGSIKVLERPGKPEEGLYTVPPVVFTYQSNTDPNTDNILRLTISDYFDNPSATGGALSWVELFQNKTIRPIPNRYYELSVDITYNLRSTPTFSPPTVDGLYQGLFLDDIFENLDQDSQNIGLPDKNLHQYFNHFYTGKYDSFTKKFTVKSTEYFMNKNNMDILFYNTTPNRGGPLSIDYKNISLNEVDMLPFFSYFSASIFDSDVYLNDDLTRNGGRSPYIPNQIDIAPKIPLQGVAPMIENVNNNFTFADNYDLFISSKIITKLNPSVVTINIIDSNQFVDGTSTL